jgi:hypothetical protein
MFSRQVRLFVVVFVAALLAASYASRAILLAVVLLGLLGAACLVARRIQAGRKHGDLLHDPAVSTLVFPPESKFRQSVLPPQTRT